MGKIMGVVAPMAFLHGHFSIAIHRLVWYNIIGPRSRINCQGNVMLTMDQIDGVRDIIVEKLAPERIILFGSYADGTARDDSDLDIFVVMDTRLSRPRRAAMVRRHLYGKVDANKDIIVMTPREVAEWRDVPHSFVHTILTRGRVIHEKQK